MKEKIVFYSLIGLLFLMSLYFIIPGAAALLATIIPAYIMAHVLEFMEPAIGAMVLFLAVHRRQIFSKAIDWFVNRDRQETQNIVNVNIYHNHGDGKQKKQGSIYTKIIEEDSSEEETEQTNTYRSKT